MQNRDLIDEFANWSSLTHEKRRTERPILKDFPSGHSEMQPPKWELNPIGVNFLPSTGGTLLCEMISCHPLFGGEEFYNSLERNRKLDVFHWSQTHSTWHPKIYKFHNDDFDLEILDKFKKFIHVSYDNTPQEIKYITLRISHIVHQRIYQDRRYTNLQLKYMRIVQNELRKNYTNWFDFPFIDFTKEKSFVDRSIKMFEYLEIEPLSTDTIKAIYRSWTKSEVKHMKMFREQSEHFVKHILPHVNIV